jgi:hypothetical protein
MNHPPHRAMLDNHVLELRTNKGADRAPCHDWRVGGLPCAVSAPRPSNWRPSFGSTRVARNGAVMTCEMPTNGLLLHQPLANDQARP